MVNLFRWFLVGLVVVVLAGCGGGSGGSDPKKDDIPPTASITHSGSTTVTEGEIVSLSGSDSSDSDGSIISYEWLEGGVLLCIPG